MIPGLLLLARAEIGLAGVAVLGGACDASFGGHAWAQFRMAAVGAAEDDCAGFGSRHDFRVVLGVG